MGFSQNTPEDEFDDVILTGMLNLKNPGIFVRNWLFMSQMRKYVFCLVSVSAEEAVTPGPAVISILTGRSVKPFFK